MDKKLEINRTNWNERTPIHAASKFYDVDGFKGGRITLNKVEQEELGDVSGKTLLHLQCHFGMDTMSWARLGANATGVDLSDVAIYLARSLNDELDLDVEFIESNVFDLPNVLDKKYDIVFTSVGVLSWISDIDKWASVVAHFLKSGGTFYIMDFHPLLGILEPTMSGEMKPVDNYWYEERFFAGNEPSYAGAGVIESPVYEWQHSLGEIVTALVSAGLRMEFLHEFPFCAYRAFPIMEKDLEGWWRFTKNNDSIPQMFSIKATK